MQKNKNIYFLSADFGAPALDKFRKDLKNQFIHTGISEQNTINVAAGLALKKESFCICNGSIYFFKMFGAT